MGERRPYRSPEQREAELTAYLLAHARDSRLTVSARTIATVCGVTHSEVYRARLALGLAARQDREG